MHGNRRRDKSPNANFGFMQMDVGTSVRRPSAVMLALRKKESGKAERAEWGNVVPREGGREGGQLNLRNAPLAMFLMAAQAAERSAEGEGGMDGGGATLPRPLARQGSSCSCARHATRTAGNKHQAAAQSCGIMGQQAGMAGGVCTFGRE